MLKVLQLGAWSGFGGGEMMMFNIIKELKNDFEFVVVAPEGEFLEKYRKMNLKIYKLSSRTPLQNILKIRKIIEKEESKILHCHGTRAAFWARLAVIGMRNKPKTIYTLHGFHLPRRSFFVRWLFLILERFLNKFTDVLVCVSEADRKLVLQYRTIPENKITVIKNGIDVEKFNLGPEIGELRKKELRIENNFVLSSIGRLHHQKDFSTILKALKFVIPEIPNVKLLIIGDGPQKESLGKETKNLVLKDFVKFLGWREDVPVLLNISDIIILSTKWEGLPLVPLEAGASKKPVVASDVDGVRETIIDGKTGFLFKPGLAEDLAEKILKLYNDKILREKMGEEGYNFVLENFNKEKMIQNYKNLYQSLV